MANGFSNYYAYFMKVTVPIFLSGSVPPWCRPYPSEGGIYEVYNGDYFYSDYPQLTAVIQNGDTLKIGVWLCHVDLNYGQAGGGSDYFQCWLGLSQLYDEVPSFVIGLDAYGHSGCSGFHYTENTSETWFKGYYKIGKHSGLGWSYLTYEVASPVGAKVFDTAYWQWEASCIHPAANPQGALWIGPRHIYHNGQVIFTDWQPPAPVDDPAPGPTGWESRVIKPNRSPWTRYDKSAPVCYE